MTSSRAKRLIGLDVGTQYGFAFLNR
jgi:hypothetical protein